MKAIYDNGYVYICKCAKMSIYSSKAKLFKPMCNRVATGWKSNIKLQKPKLTSNKVIHKCQYTVFEENYSKYEHKDTHALLHVHTVKKKKKKRCTVSTD